MSSRIPRRDFLKVGLTGAAMAGLPLGALAATQPPAQTLPTRLLGKTGLKVPILGYGTGPVGTQRTLEDGVQLFQSALEMGITYFDTAPNFAGYGQAQLQLGHAFKGRRKDVFLVTKCFKPRADDALRLLESNLKELQTDHADLVYAHSLGADEMDPAVVMGPGGVMEFLAKVKREGLARFVGVTGHNRPGRFLPILEKYGIDVMMNAVNFVDCNTYDFEEKVWPAAARKNVGLVAMKVYGGGSGRKADSLLPIEHHATSFRYALSLPGVSCAVIGMKNAEELKQNVEWAKSFSPLSREEVAALRTQGKTLAAKWGPHYGPVA
ncbi:MAG: aldo/keto reductase [Candidatus Sumerlaeaceae bacterium]|nr:aldo/keto reductase [Candidatus Sumerlaeaceae bacterium]